jgi:hypothetical protein
MFRPLRPGSGDKANLDAFSQGRRNAPQHAQAVTFVVGIFQTAYDRSCGADLLRQRPLAQAPVARDKAIVRVAGLTAGR